MKTSSITLEEVFQGLPSYLSEEQKLLLLLLRESKVEEDALVGTFLLLKDNQQEMDEMIIYIWDNGPTPQEIDAYLVEIIKRRRRKRKEKGTR